MDSVLINFLQGSPTIALVGIIFLSLYVLGKAADYLVDQSVTLSKIWGIPEVIIGATIISLGTTIPEVTVSVVSSLNGHGDMAIGNAVGSIITNTTLILGLAALIGEIPINRNLMKRQGSFLVLISAILFFRSLPFGRADGTGHLSLAMGVFFLVVLVAYMILSIMRTQNKNVKDRQEGSIPLQILKILLGVLVVVISSKILIPTVEETAIRVGIPESVIAATLVAFGTSVPELMTAITAVRKGYGEIAVGNVIGANILNILFVIGLSLVTSKGGIVISPLFVKLQMPLMLAVVSLLFIMGMNKEKKLKKSHGLIFLLIYIGYLIFNYLKF